MFREMTFALLFCGWLVDIRNNRGGSETAHCLMGPQGSVRRRGCNARSKEICLYERKTKLLIMVLDKKSEVHKDHGGLHQTVGHPSNSCWISLWTTISTSWWDYMKCQGITKVFRIHPLWNKDICKKCHGYTSKSCFDFSLVDWQTSPDSCC